MLNIYVCEDIEKQRQLISKIIENYILIEDYDMKLILETSDPMEVIQSVSENKSTGIYFLDIDLKSDLNGIQLAEQIRKLDARGFIIFITTHSEMTYLTFEYKVEAMDFIIKNNVDKMKIRIAECLKNISERYALLNNPANLLFSIKSKNRIITEEYQNIVAFMLSTNIHKVVMYSEDRQVEFYSTLKDIETALDTRFYRCNEACIINIHKIKEVDYKNRLVHMINNDSYAISVRKVKELKNKLTKKYP